MRSEGERRGRGQQSWRHASSHRLTNTPTCPHCAFHPYKTCQGHHNLPRQPFQGPRTYSLKPRPHRNHKSTNRYRKGLEFTRFSAFNRNPKINHLLQNVDSDPGSEDEIRSRGLSRRPPRPFAKKRERSAQEFSSVEELKEFEHVQGSWELCFYRMLLSTGKYECC